MAIQPIDLQAIFSQVDKVGKNQAVQREGQQINEALQQMQVQKKMEQDVQSVNQSQEMGKEAATVKDEDKRGTYENKSGAEDKDKEDENAENERPGLIRDPALGRNIDISG